MYHKYLDHELNYRSSLWICILLALLLHLPLLLLHFEMSPKEDRTASKSESPIEIEPFTDKSKRLAHTSKALEQAEDDKIKPRFSGEFKNRVKKETKSPLIGRFSEGRLPPGSSVPNQEGPGLGEKNPQLKDLLPFGTTGDYLPDDIASGNQTVLNTDPVLYASFLNRIADEIYDPWVENAREAVRTIYGVGRKLESNVYVTKLDVVMDTNGKVTQIKLLQTSGIDELDEASKKAFWDVEPFPNPPEKMFSKDGVVNLVYEFHFEWKTSSFNIVPDLI